MKRFTMSEAEGSPNISWKILLQNEVPVKSMTPIPSGTVLKTCSIKFLLYKRKSITLILLIEGYVSLQKLCTIAPLNILA